MQEIKKVRYATISLESLRDDKKDMIFICNFIIMAL